MTPYLGRSLTLAVSLALAVVFYWQIGQAEPPDQIEQWRAAAERGDAGAQYSLGRAYHRGEGLPQDFSKAFELYQKAAEQGDARAQNNLGSLYSAGQGVALDEKTAAKWFRKSAEQGIPLAQANLALLLLRGAGVEQNTAEALR